MIEERFCLFWFRPSPALPTNLFSPVPRADDMSHTNANRLTSGAARHLSCTIERIGGDSLRRVEIETIVQRYGMIAPHE